MDASPHVLVVDDHREIREPLARYLERHEVRVTVAENAAAARRALRAAAVYLVVLDLLDLTRGRGATPFDRAVDNQVSRLRRKIERDPKHPALIATVWGGGYRFTGEVEHGLRFISTLLVGRVGIEPTTT